MYINDQSGKQEITSESRSITYSSDGTVEESAGTIVHEHFLELIINEQLAARLVCTPSHLQEMVIGRMLTERYIEEITDVESVYICSLANRAKVFLKEKTLLKSSIEQEPTCCTGNQTFLKRDDLNHLERLEPADWKPEWVFSLAEEFKNGTKIHKATKGTHACFLGVKGETVFRCEDIGRHNALDKAIGYALLNGYRREECMLYTTGRVPTDMVKKAVAAKIPVLVSKAVPTDEAVEMAKYYNLTLICRAWPDKFDVYHGKMVE